MPNQDKTAPEEFAFNEPDGGFLAGLNLDDVPEEHALEEGEYKLQLQKAIFGPSKKGKPMLTLYYIAPDDPDAQLISDFILYPTQDMSERDFNQARRSLKEFLQAFGIPTTTTADEFATLGEQGLQGWCYVTKEEFQGRPRNNVKRYMTGPTE